MPQILLDRSIIEISGEQSLSFIQNLVTNNVVKNKYCYTFMLNNQGRYLFDFFMYVNDENQILIDINIDQACDFLQKLKFYKLRAKIDINVRDQYQILYSSQPLGENVIYSIKDPRYNKLGYRSLIHDKNNIMNSEIDLYLKDKYEHAIPDGYIDLIVAKSIPIEYGAEELHSIDYNKGCYIGQEVISRTKYQGVIRKKIYKIVAKDYIYLKDLPHEIKSGDELLGICCSYYENVGIALIREEKLDNIKNEPIMLDNIPIELTIPKWR